MTEHLAIAFQRYQYVLGNLCSLGGDSVLQRRQQQQQQQQQQRQQQRRVHKKNVLKHQYTNF